MSSTLLLRALSSLTLCVCLSASGPARADTPGCEPPSGVWVKHYDFKVDGTVTSDKSPKTFNWIDFSRGEYASSSNGYTQPRVAAGTKFQTRVVCQGRGAPGQSMLLTIEQTDSSDYHATYVGQWNGAVFTGTWYDNVGNAGDVRAYSNFPNTAREYVLEANGRCLSAQGGKAVLAPCGDNPPRWRYYDLASGGGGRLRLGDQCLGEPAGGAGQMRMLPCDRPEGKIRWITGVYNAVDQRQMADRYYVYDRQNRPLSVGDGGALVNNGAPSAWTQFVLR